MKNYLIILFTCITCIFTACSDEEGSEEFSTFDKLSVVTNESDGSITVAFEINSSLGATEFWTVIAKESSVVDGSIDNFEALTAAQIVKVQPSGISYSINISSSQLDSDGDALINGDNYVIIMHEKKSAISSNTSTVFAYSIEEFKSISSISIDEIISEEGLNKLKVSFEANSVAGVEEFWILVAKFSPLNELTNEYVMNLNENQYTIFDPKTLPLLNLSLITYNATQMESL